MSNSETATIHKELKRLHEEKLAAIEELREAGIEYVVEDYVDPDDEKDSDKDETP